MELGARICHNKSMSWMRNWVGNILFYFVVILTVHWKAGYLDQFGGLEQNDNSWRISSWTRCSTHMHTCRQWSGMIPAVKTDSIWANQDLNSISSTLAPKAHVTIFQLWICCPNMVCAYHVTCQRGSEQSSVAVIEYSSEVRLFILSTRRGERGGGIVLRKISEVFKPLNFSRPNFSDFPIFYTRWHLS